MLQNVQEKKIVKWILVRYTERKLIESIYKYNLNLYINKMLRGNIKDKYINARKVFLVLEKQSGT